MKREKFTDEIPNLPKKLSVNLGFNLQQQANAQGVFL
jgi:hypothetical protein